MSLRMVVNFAEVDRRVKASKSRHVIPDEKAT